MAGIFVVAMLMQIPRFNVTSNIKMTTFVCWAAFGILPSLHWVIKMGGFQNSMVAVSRSASVAIKYASNFFVCCCCSG